MSDMDNLDGRPERMEQMPRLKAMERTTWSGWAI